MSSLAAPGVVASRRRYPIARLVVRRLLVGLASLVVISLLIFLVTQALPSDPAAISLGRDATPELLQARRAALGTDRSLVAQYGDWASHIVRGDPGVSFATGQPIRGYIGELVWNSLFMVLVAGLVSIPLSIAIGSYAALKRDRKFDSVSSFVLLVLASMPEFVVGTLAVVLFSVVVFKVLPATTQIYSGFAPWSDPKGLVLPVLTLVLAVTPYVARVMRSAMVEVLESDYIEMARLKGLTERTVVRRHALPNAVGPTFQVIALNLAYLAGGVIVVERLFNFPGIGSALADAVRARDLPVIQFLALVIAGVYVLTNLVADVATILATPRLRTNL